MSKKEKWEELYDEYKANNILSNEELEGKWNSQDEEYRKRLSEIADTTSKEYKQLKSEWKNLKAEYEFEKKSLEKYKGIAKNADKIERAKSNRDVYQSLLDELLDARKEDEATIDRRTALKEEADRLEEELKELKEIEEHLRYGLKNPISTEEDKERISKRLAENIENQNKNQKAFSKNQIDLQKELEVSMHSVPEEQIEEAKQGVDKYNKVCELLAEGKTMREVTAILSEPKATEPKVVEPKEEKPEETKPEFYVPELEEDEVQAVTTGKDTTKTKAAKSKATEPEVRETKAAKTGVNIEEERKAMERFQKFTELASRREKIDKTIDEKVGLSEPKDTILKEVRDQFIDWIIDMAVYEETNPSKYSDPKDIPTREEIINKMRKELKEEYPDKTLEDALAEQIGSYIEKEINEFKSNVEKQESKAAEPKVAEPEAAKPEEIKPELVSFSEEKVVQQEAKSTPKEEETVKNKEQKQEATQPKAAATKTTEIKETEPKAIEPEAIKTEVTEPIEKREESLIACFERDFTNPDEIEFIANGNSDVGEYSIYKGEIYDSERWTVNLSDRRYVIDEDMIFYLSKYYQKQIMEPIDENNTFAVKGQNNFVFSKDNIDNLFPEYFYLPGKEDLLDKYYWNNEKGLYECIDGIDGELKTLTQEEVLDFMKEEFGEDLAQLVDIKQKMQSGEIMKLARQVINEHILTMDSNLDIDDYNLDIDELEEITVSGIENLVKCKCFYTEDTAWENRLEGVYSIIPDEELIEKYGEDINWSAVDHNVYNLICDLVNHGKLDEEVLDNYVHGVGAGLELPFRINYDLKNIYKSDLTNSEIKNLFKIAKEAKKMNPQSVEVNKDGILTRAFGRISRFMNSTLTKVGLLPTDEEGPIIDDNIEELQEDRENVSDIRKHFPIDHKRARKNADAKIGNYNNIDREPANED